MTPKNLPTSDPGNTRTNSLVSIQSRRLILRVSAILVLAGLLAGSLFWGSAASAYKSAITPGQKATVVRDEITAPLSVAGLSSSTSLLLRNYPLFLAIPQGPPVTVTTYAGDCETPKSVFNLQASEFSVCAKVTGADPSWQIIWSNARFIQVQNTPVGTGESTFTLSPSSSLGDWRVILYEPFGGSVYGLTPFTVVDDGNPSADLTISKTALADSVAAGSQATFAVQLTNLGPSGAATVQVSDSVPANTTFSSFALVSGPAGFNCITPEVGSSTGDTICTVASMARGETAVFVAAYDVIGVSPGTVISNTASVSSATADPSLDNNSSTATLVVSGAGAETCTLDCPANVVVTADTTSGGQFGAFVTFAAAAGAGNCGAVTNTPQSGSFLTVGTHSITSTSELGGASCSFTVTVLDTAAPTITCPPNKTVTAPAGETEATVSVGTPTINASGGGTVTGVRSDDIPATFDDNGNVVTPAVVHALTDPYPIGSTGILWTVTDAGDRKASCTQIITVLEADARDAVSISCPAHVTATAPDGFCQATIPPATIGTPTTNPSDSNVEVSAQRSDGQSLSDPFPAGTTTITWTAHDNITNTSASCVQNVTVTVSSTDTTPPTFVAPLPPNLSVTTSSCTATLDDELGTAEATDGGACGGSVTITRTGVPANFVFPTGTTTIIYTATDASGNTATHLQLVTVTESPAVPPTITAPADVSANTGPGATSCGTVVTDATLGNAIASDNCPGVTVTRTGVPAGNFFPVGNTIVTYTATDASGNTAQDTQTVTVTDNTVPIITPPGPVTLFTGAGATSCGVTVANLDTTLGTGSATDNCPGVGAVTRSGVPAGNVFPLGNTTVTYSATDAHGNTGSATQVVTVVDNTPPQISCPANIVIEPTCPTGAIATWTPPVGTDNCPGATTTRTAGGAPGTVFSIGTTTVTYSVSDANGNGPVTCSFTVTVLTPQAVIQNLQAAVSASSLTGTQKNGLLAKLSAALQGINNGQPNVACPKLNDFINSVQNLVSHGDLSAAQGNAWISSANHVRNTIGCTNLPCT